MSTKQLQTWSPLVGDLHGIGIWAGLTSDPLTGVAVVRLNGELVYLNDRFVSIYFQDQTVSELVGRSLWGFFPSDFVRERIAIAQRVLESGEPSLVRTLWNGHQVMTRVNPLAGDAGLPLESRRLLVLVHRCVSADGSIPAVADDPGYVESEVMRLGPLDVLTARELEVLSMVGQGLSIREIAKVLCRSEKTIQNHRDSIGAKLGVKNRVQVAQFAHRAGLRVEDANRIRV